MKISPRQTCGWKTARNAKRNADCKSPQIEVREMSKGQQKSFVVAGDAYAKMVMHINKYPYLAVNGVLLGSKSNGDAAIQIVDYIPFFHGDTLAPMLEAAMMLVRCHSATPTALHCF